MYCKMKKIKWFYAYDWLNGDDASWVIESINKYNSPLMDLFWRRGKLKRSSSLSSFFVNPSEMH